MVKTMKLKGSRSFRQRLVLATLSSTTVTIEGIRADDTSPGLRQYELSFLRLLEKISNDSVVEINETGTKLKYKPGVLMGRRFLVHDCGLSRSMGYFLEPLIVLGMFGKKPLSITLKGITNDSKDPSVDTFRSTTFNILKRFGVPSDGLNLKIESRGSPPLGGGVVELSVPIVEDSLKAVSWDDAGLVKRIRGVSFSTRLNAQYDLGIIHAARGILNRLCFDVFISTDHKKKGQDEHTQKEIEQGENTYKKKVQGAHTKKQLMQCGNSPGYGISLVAETTSGCFISVDTAVSKGRLDEEDDEIGEDKKDCLTAEEVGEKIASLLCGEIGQGGVVDSTHQGLLFLLCSLCPRDVSKVRVGKLSPHGIETLRNVKDFLGVTFAIKPDPSNETVVLKCVGSGLQNLSRKLS